MLLHILMHLCLTMNANGLIFQWKSQEQIYALKCKSSSTVQALFSRI